VSSISACLAQIKAGKARPLAMFGAARSNALPDVPTMRELGYAVEYYLWVGAFAPKGTPANVVAYLGQTLDKAAHADQFKTALANLGQELAYMNQAEFAKFWDADAARIEAAIRTIGKVEG
jgi:tripartite-type tricarboxylate transporter receptor subunit TctC